MGYRIEKTLTGLRVEMRPQRSMGAVAMLGFFFFILSAFPVMALFALFFLILAPFEPWILLVFMVCAAISALWLFLGFGILWQFFGRQGFELHYDGTAQLSHRVWKFSYRKRYKTAALSNFHASEYRILTEHGTYAPSGMWMVYFDCAGKRTQRFGQGFDALEA